MWYKKITKKRGRKRQTVELLWTMIRTIFDKRCWYGRLSKEEGHKSNISLSKRKQDPY